MIKHVTADAAVDGQEVRPPSGRPSFAERSSRLRVSAKRRGVVRSVLFHAVSMMVAVVLLYPALWMVFSSLKPNHEIIGNPSLFSENASLDNFGNALKGIAGNTFWAFFTNSLIVACLSVVGVTMSCSLAAYAFSRIKFPGRNVFFVCMIGTLLLPFHVVIIPQYIVFNTVGLVGGKTYASFIPLLIGKFLAADAFFVFLMVQFMRGLPNDLDEAARIDGAGHPRIFFSIMLPLMKPALVTSSIFAFIWAWNDFFAPLIYLNSPQRYTLMVALRLYVDPTSGSDYGTQMAMAVLALVPVLLFFLAFQRQIVGGIATSGLKG
ncbi:MAG: carbohydrate ABC transporter permease [Bifidobacteriaceae bacterium]|jgi:multiple sugar transport system permease protein|nr:carbohydrate ABC transporter permease [Bifidobacteriaceae bacterium]